MISIPRAAALKFALLSRSSFVTDDELRRLQAMSSITGAECAADWGQPAPLVRVVSSDTEIADDEIPTLFSPSIDAPGDLAYHTWMQSRPFALVLSDPAQVTLQDVEEGCGHEVCETIVDPPCDRYVPLATGAEIALEVCDPTQGNGAPIDLGSGVPVLGSNWVTPAWFSVDSPPGTKLDHLGVISTPLTVQPLGYAVIVDADGKTRQIGPGPAAFKRHPAFRFGRRLAHAHARGMRRRLGLARIPETL